MSGRVARSVTRIRTFAAQPRGRKLLAVEAAWRLVVASASVRRRGQWAALDKFARRLTAAEDETTAPCSEPAALLRDIAWSIAAWSSWLPADKRCLVEALAAAQMLSRRDVSWVLHVGLDRDEESQLVAHAWVMVGERVIVGGSSVGRFARLVAYAPLVET